MIRNVADQKIRRVPGQFLERVHPRRHGDDAGADRPGALNVERGIADDPDAFRRDVRADEAMHLAEGFTGDVVAVEVMVAEPAEREMFEQAEMSQLGPCSRPHVARQQTDGDVLALPEFHEQLRDAGQHSPPMLAQTVRQSRQIAREDLVEIRLRLGNVVNVKKLANDGPIRSAAVGDLRPQHDAELLGEGRFQSRLARAAAGEQRSVDVEQANDHVRHCIKSSPLPGRRPAPALKFSGSFLQLANSPPSAYSLPHVPAPKVLEDFEVTRIVCQVLQGPDRVTFLWAQDAATFEPYHLTGTAAQRLHDAARQAKETLAKSDLAALVKIGQELYAAIFPEGDSVAGEVWPWLEGLPEITSFEIVGDAPGLIPWNVVHEPGTNDISGFWGVRYPLGVGRRVNPLRQTPVLPESEVLLVLDPGLPQEKRDAWQQAMGGRGWETVTSGFQLMKSLQARCPAVLYLGGSVEGRHLTLGAEKITLEELRGWIDDAEEGNPEPLVFVDATGAKGAEFLQEAALALPGLITWEGTSDGAHGPAVLSAIVSAHQGVGVALQGLRQSQGLPLLGLSAFCPPTTQVGGEVKSEGTLYALPETPYRPLASYDREDRPLFAGRDRDVYRFTSLLDESSTRLVLLHGASGVGKSSFLRAGVVPYLEDDSFGYLALRDRTPEPGVSADERELPVLSLRATGDLAGQLAEALAVFCAKPFTITTPAGATVSVPLPELLREAVRRRTEPVTEIMLREPAEAITTPGHTPPALPNVEPVEPVTLWEACKADPAFLGRLLETITSRLPRELVIMIEQGEELITQGLKFGNRRRPRNTLEMLLEVVKQAPRCKIVLSLRTEFLGRLYSALPREQGPTLWREYSLTELKQDELLQAVLLPTATEAVPFTDEVPAAKYQFDFADGFAEQLVDRVRASASKQRVSVTALLQVVCGRLYAYAKRRRLKTVGPSELRAVGGVDGAIIKWIDDRINTLDIRKSSQRILRRLFESLYASHPDGTVTRDPLPADHVQAMWGTSDVQEAQKSVNAAVDAGLLEIQQLMVEGREQVYVSPTQDALGQMAVEQGEEKNRKSYARTRVIDTLWLMIPLACLAGAVAFFFAKQNFGGQLEDTKEKFGQMLAQNEKQILDLSGPLYVGFISQAQQAWQANNLTRMRQLLLTQQHIVPRDSLNAKFDVDQRGFEWYYLWRLANNERYLLGGHTAPVQAVAVAPKDQLAATGSQEGKLFVWDLSTGKIRATLTGHEGPVHGLAFSDDAKTLAVAGRDGVALWDMKLGDGHEYLARPGQSLTAHKGAVRAVVFAGGSLITAGDDQKVIVWDKNKPKHTLNGGNALARSSDGKVLASAGDDAIFLWDAATGKQLYKIDAQGQTQVLAFSPDGTTLASGAGDSATDAGAIRLWDATTGKPKSTPNLRHGPHVFGLAFTPDGKTLLSTGKDQLVRRWDTTTFAEQGLIKGHLGWVSALAVSPDGDSVITGSYDATVKVWNLHSGDVLKPGSEPVTSVAISGDDKLLAAGGKDGKVTLWNLDTGKVFESLKDMKGSVTGLAFTRGIKSHRLAVAYQTDKDAGEIKVWEFNADDKGKLEKAKEIFTHQKLAHCLALSGDGRRVAFGSGSSVYLWELEPKKAPAEIPVGHTKTVRSLSFNKEGRFLASGSDDGTMRIWVVPASVPMPQSPLRDHRGPVLSVYFLPNNLLLSGSADQTLKVWLVDEKVTIFTQRGHSGPVSCLAGVSLNSLFTGSADATIKINAATIVVTEQDLTGAVNERFTLNGHAGPVRSLALTSDNQILVSAGDDGTVRIWRAPRK